MNMSIWLHKTVEAESALKNATMNKDKDLEEFYEFVFFKLYEFCIKTFGVEFEKEWRKSHK